MHSPPPHAIPDYVRCGSSLIYLTWTRLLVFLAAIALSCVVIVETAEHLPTESELLAEGVPVPTRPSYLASLTRTLKRQLGGREGGKDGGLLGGKGGMRKPAVLKRFCEAKSSTYYLNTWSFASLGAPGWPSPDDDVAYCDWQKKTKTAMPFSICTFNTSEDTQISSFIHREGLWNGAKVEVMEAMLPRVNEMMDMPERSLVIDIGANIGFFTLLAGTRGYDTIAIEPSKEALIRLLYSLRANGIKAATSGDDRGINSGHTRRPVSYVFRNAGYDSYSSAQLRYVPDNPGASWVVKEGAPVGAGYAVSTVFLDDLLDGPRYRDPAVTTKHPGEEKAVVVDPTTVRAIKISAEGLDSRVINGLRRTLSLGRVPYLLMVYNEAHVTNAGCSPSELIRGLLDLGYRLYHAGVFIYREPELGRFLKGMTGRSTELVFVLQGAPFF